MPDFQSILSAASQLPIDDRLRLIDALVDSVPDNATPGLSPLWLDEIERRDAELKSGTAVTREWGQIRGRLESKLGTDSAS